MSYTLAYDNAGLYLTNLSDSTSRSLPLPAAEDGLSLKDIHGYQPVILPNILHKNNFYAVMSHSQVLRINTDTGKSQPVYSSVKPIVGMASSPNGKLIGLMVQDKRFMSEADLVIIDEKGQVQDTFPKAAYLSHSDGYINTYALEWVDDNTVRVRTEFPEKQEQGYKEFNLSARSIEALPDFEQHRKLLEKLAEKERDFFPAFSPDQSRLAYATRSNDGFFTEIWVTDLTGSTERFVGIGQFLGWISETAIAWAEYSAGEPDFGR
ncbi:hypothetical protein D3C75_693360 [compost metagenome]